MHRQLLSYNFCESESRWAQLLPLQSLPRLKLGIGRSTFLTRGSGEESTPKLIRVVGQIQFLAFVVLWSWFPCWLPIKGRPLLLGTATFLLMLSVWPP